LLFHRLHVIRSLCQLQATHVFLMFGYWEYKFVASSETNIDWTTTTVTLHSWNFYRVCMWHDNVISIYFPAGDLFISCCKSTENGMPWNHFSVQRNYSFQQFFDISTYDCQSILYCSEKACPNTFIFFSKNVLNLLTNALFLFEGFVVTVITIIACFRIIRVS